MVFYSRDSVIKKLKNSKTTNFTTVDFNIYELRGANSRSGMIELVKVGFIRKSGPEGNISYRLRDTQKNLINLNELSEDYVYQS